MTDNKPLVIVLSRIYSTGLSVIRSLGAAGYTVDLVASAHREGASKIASSSKYLRHSVEIVSRKVRKGRAESTAVLVDELMKYAGQYDPKPVLFPTDDFTASVVDQHMDRLAPHFQMPHIIGGGAGSLTAHMDKTMQSQLAKEVGLLTPKEWILSLKEEIQIPEDMVYPCFCKPAESITGFKREMAACENEESLRLHLEGLKERHADRHVLVQEFLNIDNEIDLSGVCFDQQVIIPAIIKKSRVAQHEKGVTLAGTVVPLDEIESVREKIFELMKRFHYVGMFDMELNVVGDKLYFNEVNLRSGGPNYAYFKCGVNLPDLFVRHLMGQGHTPEEEQVTQCNKSFIYEKVAWTDYMYGHMTKKELDDTIRQSDITLLYSNDDPKPQKVFLRKIKISHMYLRMKQFLNTAILPGAKKIFPRLIGLPQYKKKNKRDANSTNPRVLISGRNYCSNLCLARSFGEAGYDVEILRIYQVRPRITNYVKLMMLPDAYSKYIKAFHICITHRKSRVLVDRLINMADPNHKMLLIPADDLVASITDSNLDLLSQYYQIPSIANRQGAINELMSKETQMEAAAAAGLPVINSCLIASKNGEFTIPDSISYPCFMKPNISKNSSKTKMCKCDNKQQLHEKLMEYTAKADVEMLVEDFVNIKREYALLGLSTKEGVVMPGFFGTLEGGHDARRGVAMTGETLPHTGYEELFENITRFVGSLGYEGLFDVDLIETVEGKMYFVELNLRYGASGYAITQSGANLPGMFADYMLCNKPIDLNCQVKPGTTFVSEKVMLEEFIAGFLTRKDMRRIMKEADVHFVYNPADRKAYPLFRFLSWISGPLRKYVSLKKAKAAEQDD